MLFKADPELAATILTPLFTKIWEQEEIPSDWSRRVITKIPKKGSKVIVITGVESPFCLCQLKSFEKSLYNVSPKLLMTFSEANKLDFARGVDVRIKSSHCGIYLSNVQSGIGSCM